MASKTPLHREADPFARRLMLAGCLLMLAPLACVLTAAAFFGWPATLALLPREAQPVAPADPSTGETLVLVAGFVGSGGEDPA
ncbi:MAG: hypothetical protein IT326_01910, partial [Anaerolineae bacterium]|nr:hypothetical protein [Anaerolineae bacterium]